MDFVILFITCPSKKESEVIVKALLKKRLIACANTVSNVRSVFRWKGKIENAREELVIIKTPKAHYKAIEHEVKRIHSYEVPEIIAVPIIAGHKPYLNWVAETTRIIKRKKPRRKA